MDGSKPYLLVIAEGTDPGASCGAPKGSLCARAAIKVDSLPGATKALNDTAFDAVLLDAAFANGRLEPAVDLLVDAARETPVVVLAESAQVPAAIEAVRRGAHDYIVVSGLDGDALDQSLQLCIDRFRQAAATRRELRESRKAQTRLECLIRDSADAMLLLDPSGRIIFANPAAGRLFDRDAASLVGIAPGIPPDGPAQLELDLSRHSGRETIADIRVTQTLWDDEPAFLATLRDTTARKRAERSLLLAKQQAEMASEMKTSFLANISHELRTPLNSIIGFTDIMRKGVFGDIGSTRYADYLSTIHTSGMHLLTLINNLLDLAKIEAGREELEETTIDIVDLLKSAARSEEAAARDHGVTLSCDVAGTPRLLRGDRIKLNQIILNLLSNAIKFTPEGGRVALSGRAVETGCYEIAVADSGCGMDQTEIAEAMGHFAQIRNPYQRPRDRGTGLGLPIARSLVELHNGSLQIASRPGEGTRVAVLLPAARIVDRPAMPRSQAS